MKSCDYKYVSTSARGIKPWAQYSGQYFQSASFRRPTPNLTHLTWATIQQYSGQYFQIQYFSQYSQSASLRRSTPQLAHLTCATIYPKIFRMILEKYSSESFQSASFRSIAPNLAHLAWAQFPSIFDTILAAIFGTIFPISFFQKTHSQSNSLDLFWSAYIYPTETIYPTILFIFQWYFEL